MSYTPQNVQAFTSSYSGALAGMSASNRFPKDPNASNYVDVAMIAGAFAQELDTLRGSAVPNVLELYLIESLTNQFWFSRAPLSSILNFTPTTYAKQCAVVLGLVQAGIAYFAAQGIVPPTPGSGGGTTTSLVWQPGGTTGGNVYATPTELAAACKLLAGDVDISIDTSLGTASISAPGTYDFGAGGARTFVGNPQVSFLTGVTIAAADIVLKGLTGLYDCLIVNNSTNASGVIQTTGQLIFRQNGQGGVQQNAGASPFFDTKSGGLLELYMAEEGGIIKNSTGVNALHAESGGTIVVRMHDGAFINTNMLNDSAGAGQIIIETFSPSVAINPTQASWTNQTLINGSLAANVAYTDTAPLLGATQVQAAIDALKSKGGATVIIKPGGVASGNVYTTLLTGAAAARAINGNVTILFDTSVAALPDVAAGTYDFGSSGNRTFQSGGNQPLALITTLVGAAVIFKNVTNLKNVEIVNNSTVTLFQFDQASPIVTWEVVTFIEHNGGASVISLGSGGTLFMKDQAEVGFGSGSNSILATSGFCALVLEDDSYVDTNQLSDNSGAATLSVQQESGAVTLRTPQSGWTNTGNFYLGANIPYVIAVSLTLTQVKALTSATPFDLYVNHNNNANLTGAQIIVTQAFAAPGLSGATMTIQANGDAAGAILGATSMTVVTASSIPGSNPYPSRSSGARIQGTITATGAALSALTAGTFSLWLYFNNAVPGFKPQ